MDLVQSKDKGRERPTDEKGKMATHRAGGGKFSLILAVALVCAKQANSQPDQLQRRITEGPGGSPKIIGDITEGLNDIIEGPGGSPEGIDDITEGPGGSPEGIGDITEVLDYFADREERSLPDHQDCAPNFYEEVDRLNPEKGEFFKASIQKCDLGLPPKATFVSGQIVHKAGGEACTRFNSPDEEVIGLPCAKCQDPELIMEIEYKINGERKRIEIALVDEWGQRKAACSKGTSPASLAAIIISVVVVLVVVVLVVGVLIVGLATGNIPAWWKTTRQLLPGPAGCGRGGEGGAGAEGRSRRRRFCALS